MISAVAGIITALHACVELVRRAKEGRSLNPFTSEARATRRERDTREYLCKQLLASLEEALQDFQKRTKNDLRNYGRLFAQGDGIQSCPPWSALT